MPHLDDPALLSPEERLEEIAAILAEGYLNLRRKMRYLPTPPKDTDSKEKKANSGGINGEMT